MAELTALLGPKLLKPGGAEVDTSSLQGAVVALYFSAHWCPPCKGFTPQFAKVYKRCKEQGKSFDVVFVSSDNDAPGFSEYFATMPWHALPFARRDLKEILGSRFGVRGIPSVVLLSSSGSIIDGNARSKVMDPSFPSTLPSVLEAAAAKTALPEGPILVKVLHQHQEHEFEVIPEEGWELLRMQIFSATSVPAEQQRLFGLGREKGVLTDDLPLSQALASGLLAQKGSGCPLANVEATARSASCTWKDAIPGEGLHQGRLDSGKSWSGKNDDPDPWYQMDLSDTRPVAGVIIAPRADCAQWTTKFKVSYADAEAGPWDFAGDGCEFEGNSSSLDPPRRVLFPEPVAARFVRIHPTAYHAHRSLRADVLLFGDDDSADKPPCIVVLGNFAQEDPFQVRDQPPVQENDKLVQEQHLAFLQARLSSAPGRLQHEVNSLQHVFKYEDPVLQRQALDQIPVCAIAEACASQTHEGYELAFMRKLLHWFKHEFFTWTNAPRCEHCGSHNTKTVGGARPDQIEQAYGAGSVEVALCNNCGGQTRFPRYNHPGKLLETRQGRCGEWANCFTLICRALGYEARHVHDWTDHVWTEVYSDSLGRWVHLDSCEAALDCPLVYEQGWGKKLTYCLAYARDNVVDVTKRYTKKYAEVLTRRTQFPEDQLARVMTSLDEFALEREVAKLDTGAAEERRTALTQRREREAKEFAETVAAELKAGEQVGRTSGDKEWREQRGELGANAEAKAKALECSDSGVANLGGTPAAPMETADGWLECSLGRVESSLMSDEPQVHRSVPLSSGVQQVRVSCRWKDQGFGNQKGQLFLAVKRGSAELCRQDCFGIAAHTWETKSKTFSAAELSSPTSGDSLVILYRVGGGGGHQITVEDLKISILKEAPAPPSEAVPCAAGASKSPAAVASAGEQSCATPPASETPSRPQSASKKEEMQALVKKAFAELVASGMAPNDAAPKALARAKEMMAASA